MSASVRALVIGVAGWQVASGLWMGVGPRFGLGADGTVTQAALAGHAMLGPLLALLLPVYLWGHVPRVRKLPRPALRALGLAAALLTSGAVASGLVILIRSALGLHTADSWRTYHFNLALAGMAALSVHLVIVCLRGWVRGAIAVAAACAASVLLAGLAVRPAAHPAGSPQAAAARQAAWSAPANRSCGTSGCHAELHREWSASAHAAADRDPYYLALERRLVQAGELAAVSGCNECHDPTVLEGGAFTRWQQQGARGEVPHSGEAVGCLVCHAMTEAHGTRPRGNYRLGEPRRALYDGTALGNLLLRASPRAHAKANTPPLYQRSRLCAACHRADVSQPVPGLGLLRIENPHSRWALSQVKPTCQECHMPQDERHGHASHRFAGSTLHLSADPEQQRVVGELLAGRTELPAVTGELSRGPLITLSVGQYRPTTSGIEIPIAIRHTGRIGHQFPAGAQDLIQLWIEGELVSGTRSLARWGEAAPGGPLLPGTPVFRRGGLTRGPQGPEAVSHPWALQGVTFPLLRPLETVAVTITAPRPGTAAELSLRLRYRKLSGPALAAIGPGANGRPLPLPPSLLLSEGRWPVEAGR